MNEALQLKLCQSGKWFFILLIGGFLPLAITNEQRFYAIIDQ
jgi:hypothetical protein